MPQDAIFRKASLFIVTGPSEHLHVVMNDPIDYPLKAGPAVLLVNFCSYDPLGFHDATCLLNRGDHPFIRHPTFVDYRNAVLTSAGPLDNDLLQGIHRAGAPVSGAVYDRILYGFKVSRRVSANVSRFIRFAGL